MALVVCLLPSGLDAADKQCPLDKRAEWQRSVVIAETDKDIFTLDRKTFDFSFAHTIETILKSAELPYGPAEQVATVKSLIDSFAKTSEPHPFTPRTVEFEKRDAEFALKAEDLLNESSPNGLKPVGLFNRFDQAPMNWNYCGEHRIVYAKNSTVRTDRFLLIFEAAVANPHPEFGREGCRPIADLWQSLKGEKDKSKIAQKLADFYYKGIPGADPSSAIPPVLHVKHFGNPFGQVRGNIFVQRPWQLRQWRIDPITGQFKMFTIGTNPQPGLYGPEGGANPLDPRMVRGFQDVFVRRLVAQLTAADGISATPDEKRAVLVNNIGMLGDAVVPWDDFISNAQTPNGTREDNPEVAAKDATAFKDGIKGELQRLSLSLEPEHVLARAGATSCGGCHDFSNGKTLAIGSDGKPITWPDSLRFVHIDEDSKLSPLLTDVFLADRCEKMNEIFFKVPPPPAPPAPEAVAALRQSPPTALFDLQRQIQKSPVDPAVKAALGRAAEASIPSVRAADRGSLGALGQIRHSD